MQALAGALLRWRGSGPYLDDEDDDGVLVVIMGWVRSLEDATLMSSANTGSRSRRGAGRPGDECGDDARHDGMMIRLGRGSRWMMGMGAGGKLSRRAGCEAVV